MDLWRGRLTYRRAAVLTAQLPAGSRVNRARGGPAAWSDEVAAIHHEGHRIVSAAMVAGGANQHELPDPVDPPKPGWQAEARDKSARADAKARRWVQRNQARKRAT